MEVLRLPLRLDGSGRAVTTSLPAEIWKDRVAVVLGTAHGERPGDLAFGTTVNDSLFSPVDEIEGELAAAIATAFVDHLPGIDLVSTEVDSLDSSSPAISLSVLFSIPDGSDAQVSLNLSTAVLGQT